MPILPLNKGGGGHSETGRSCPIGFQAEVGPTVAALNKGGSSQKSQGLFGKKCVAEQGRSAMEI
jgi:hypothetical protein